MITPTRVRRRFWLEIAAVTVSIVLWIATLLWPDWIELVFHVDPDGRDGSVERAIAILLPAIALAWAIAAGWEWRRPRRETALNIR
jgi:hypothetical protein